MPSAKTERTPSGIALPAHDPKPAANAKGKKGEGRGGHFSARVPQFPLAQFQTELDAIKPEEWGRFHFYVYRSHPVCDHKLSGRDYAYLENVERAVGDVRTYVLNQHAGGEYFLILDDKNKTTGTAICRTVFEIPWHEAPPVLNVEELVLGHPKNKGYEEFLRARGQHPEQESYMRPPQLPPQGGNVSDIVKLVLPILQQALNKDISPAEKGYIDYLKVQAESAARANDPTKLIDMFIGLQKLTTPAAPVADQAATVAITMLQDELKALRESNAKLQERLLDTLTKKQEAPSLLGQVKEIAGILTAVKDLLPRSSGAADAVHPRVAMIQAVQEAAQPLLEALPGVLQTWALTRAQQAGIRVEPGVHYPANPEIMPPSADPAQRGAEPPAGAPPRANGSGGQMIPPHLLKLAHELGRLMFSAIEREVPGDEWARSFIDLNGLTMYRQICGLGRDQILQVLVSLPDFAPRVETFGPVLVQFIDDFIAGPGADGDGDGDEEAAAEPPPPAGPQQRPAMTFRKPPAASSRETPGRTTPPISRMAPAASGTPPPAGDPPAKRGSRARTEAGGTPPKGPPDGS